MSLVVGNTEVIDSDRNLKNVAYIIEDGDVEDGAVLVRDSTKDSKVSWSNSIGGGSSNGSGDVIKVGSPANNQIGVWTGDGTIEGTNNFTFDGAVLNVEGNIVVSGNVDGRDIATDGAVLDSLVLNALIVSDIGTSVQAFDSGLNTLSLPDNTTISVFGASLIDDADASAARSTLGVDEAGTDNSVNVTLVGSLDYITISGQQITRNAIDLTTDITGILPVVNGGTGASDAATARSNLGLSIGSNVQAFAAQVSSGEKTAGTETALRTFSPKDVADMAGTHGGGGANFGTILAYTMATN